MSLYSKVEWPDLWFGPINLYSFWSTYHMSGGMEDWAAEEHQKRAPASSHYQQAKPEPIEVIEGWNLSFNLGQVIKYIGRAKHKGSGYVDLQKALWYLEREVALLGNQPEKTPIKKYESWGNCSTDSQTAGLR